MPELPEVETTKRGISPHIMGQTITQCFVRQPKLRWPIPASLKKNIVGATILNISRRAKYLLIETDKNTLLIHLGMSGCLRILDSKTPIEKHDHVDFVLNNHLILRYTDPRRFGAILWEPHFDTHPLLVNLGLEPLDRSFNGDYLAKRAENKTVAIKNFIMDNHVVVGVGNIYATESLFLARIHPNKPAKTVNISECETLAKIIKSVLKKAIRSGGTTLKDFRNSDGKPGYFKQSLQVYQKAGQPCPECGAEIQSMKIGQRTTAFCNKCQS